MLWGIVLIVLGCYSLFWVTFRGASFARNREHDRELPWLFNWAPYGWTRKTFAALPLPVDRALQFVISLLMIAGGIWVVAQ